MKKQDFTVLKIADLHPFPDNPFRLVEDELLMELAESIKEFGVVTPIITRPKEDGNGYEVIAGQRRVRASQLAGIETIPAFVLPLDRDRAIITLVDSNIQRENILPSERAFAYKMKLEAMKRQGYRTDLTSDQVGQKLTSVGDSGKAIGRQPHTGTAIYPSDRVNPADFTDGGRGADCPYPCGGTVFFEERRAGKPADYDGE